MTTKTKSWNLGDKKLKVCILWHYSMIEKVFEYPAMLSFSWTNHLNVDLSAATDVSVNNEL